MVRKLWMTCRACSGGTEAFHHDHYVIERIVLNLTRHALNGGTSRHKWTTQQG